MEKQSKRGNNISKEDEWILLDEKIYHLQGAKAKVTGQRDLSPNETGPGNGHFQEINSRSNLKFPRRRPQELISVDNVSRVTARQGNKIPYYHTSSAPLPGLSPSRISPPSASTSSRTPCSAPAQMISTFSWPPVQEHKEQPKSKGNHDVPQAGESGEIEKARVCFPYIKPQTHHQGESKSPTYKELSTRHKTQMKQGPNLSEDERYQTASEFTRKHHQGESSKNKFPTCKDLGTPHESQVRRECSRSEYERYQTAPIFTNRSRTLDFSTRQKESKEVFKAKNIENHSSSYAFPACRLQSPINSSHGKKQVSFSGPVVRQGTKEDMSSLKRENGSEVKKATIKNKKEDVFCQPKIDHTAHVVSERWQKNVAPQRKRRERSRQTESDGPKASNEQTESRSEQDDFEEVFEFAPSPGSRTQQAVSGLPQKAMSVDTARDAPDPISSLESSFPLSSGTDQEKNHVVFALPPVPGSRTQQVVSGLPQKTTSVGKARVAHDQGKDHYKNMIELCNTVRKLNMPISNGQRNLSPDSFVAQLIANSEKLILNDSIESPALQERKKLARNLRKKFY